MKYLTVVIEYTDDQPIPMPNDAAPVMGGYVSAWEYGDVLRMEKKIDGAHLHGCECKECAETNVTCPECGRKYWTYPDDPQFECSRCSLHWDEGQTGTIEGGSGGEEIETSLSEDFEENEGIETGNDYPEGADPDKGWPDPPERAA